MAGTAAVLTNFSKPRPVSGRTLLAYAISPRSDTAPSNSNQQASANSRSRDQPQVKGSGYHDLMERKRQELLLLTRHSQGQ